MSVLIGRWLQMIGMIILPVGLLIWYIVVKGLNRAPRNGAMLRVYDRTIVPIARVLDRVPVPFGQSVLAVARVPK